MFEFMIVLGAIALVFAVFAVLADMPKSKAQLVAAMESWAVRLLETDEFYFEAMRDLRTTKMMGMAFGQPGMSDFDAWHYVEGYSWLRDRLTFALFEHRRGRHLFVRRLFFVLDRIVPTA